MIGENDLWDGLRMKFKVGDKVRVIGDVPNCAKHSSVCHKWAGKVMTIRAVIEYGGVYLMSEAGGWWFDTDFAGLATDTECEMPDACGKALHELKYKTIDSGGMMED